MSQQDRRPQAKKIDNPEDDKFIVITDDEDSNVDKYLPMIGNTTPIKSTSRNKFREIVFQTEKVKRHQYNVNQ